MAVVTGISAGIGLVTAAALVQRGWRVIGLVRDPARGEAAARTIAQQAGGAAPELVIGDLASLASVRTAAAEIARRTDRLQVLVNNAGALIATRRLSADGHELTLAGNHLGPFLLTHLLLPALERGAPARIVNVSSRMHELIDDMQWDDLQLERRYGAMRAYAHSKLANILHVRELARRLDPARVTANAVHPGGVRTRLGTGNGLAYRIAMKIAGLFMTSPERGADTSIWLAADPEPQGRTGGYWYRRRAGQPSPAARSDAGAARLWALSETLCRI
ncbi:MAG: SDR family oxidoreductase [Gammaproteobacteria bacterium]